MAENTTTYPEHPAKNCLDDWENDLKEVSNRLKWTTQQKSGISSKFSNSTLWESKLKLYWNSLEKTEEYIHDIGIQLELFIEQTELVCKNIDCSREAIAILFCRVREIFICTDELREKIADFNMKVECLNDDGINVKSSIVLQCLATLSVKLEQAVAKQTELIKKLLEILQCIYEIKEYICDTPCGVKGVLVGLRDVFKYSEDDSGYCPTIEWSCEPSREPTPELPLRTDRVYGETREQHKLSTEERKNLRKELDEICKEFESLASCERGLKEAIECSKAVQECK